VEYVLPIWAKYWSFYVILFNKSMEMVSRNWAKKTIVIEKKWYHWFRRSATKLDRPKDWIKILNWFELVFFEALRFISKSHYYLLHEQIWRDIRWHWFHGTGQQNWIDERIGLIGVFGNMIFYNLLKYKNITTVRWEIIITVLD
jgi:hypothetical protein